MLKKLTLLFFVALLHQEVLSAQKKSIFDDYLAQPLVMQATAAFSTKDYQTALAKYQEAGRYGFKNYAWYDAARCASLLGNFEKADSCLTIAVENGFLDESKLRAEESFTALKTTPHWDAIIQRLTDQINILETAFKPVKDQPLTDLVPYKSGNKWGYLHKQTQQVVVPANYRRTYFAGDCLRVDISNSPASFNIDAAGKLFINQGPQLQFSMPMPVQPIWVTIDNLTKDFKGFHVVANQITDAAAVYGENPDYSSDMESLADWPEVSTDASPASQVPIVGPYKMGKKWYAIVKKNGRYGLIDEAGNPHPKLGFDYKYLYCWDSPGKPAEWFYFVDLSGNQGFISSSGKFRFFNEIDKTPSVTFYKTPYVRAQKGSKSGVIDLSTMQWLIPPVEGRIIRMEFTYTGDCSTYISGIEGIKPIEHFFWVHPDQKQAFTPYYIGQNGKAYRQE